MIVFSFPFSLVHRFLHLSFLMAPMVSADYPFLDVKCQLLSFGLLAFRWDIVTDNAAGLSIRGSNLSTRTPFLSVPE